jgi:hypothetical protein
MTALVRAEFRKLTTTRLWLWMLILGLGRPAFIRRERDRNTGHHRGRGGPGLLGCARSKQLPTVV